MMNNENIFEGKDIEEALAKASSVLNVEVDELSYQVEENEKIRVFPWGEKKVKIKVTHVPKHALSATAIVKSLVENICPKATYSEVKNGMRFCVEIDCQERGLLIGTQGKTLEALQYLTNIIYSKSCQDGSKIIIDIGGYRDSKKMKLMKQVERIADNVKTSGRVVKIPQLNSYDRRAIHLLISEKAGLSSYSEGEGRLKDVYIETINIDEE